MNYIDKQKIGTYQNVDLVIDFTDLFRYKGSRAFYNRFNKRLGIFLIVLGVIIVFLPLLLLDAFNATNIIQGILNPPNAAYVIPFFGIYVVIYGFYLSREKNKFRDFTENLNLQKAFQNIKKGNVKELEIENFFTEKMLEYIDTAFYTDPTTFVNEFSKLLLTPEIQTLLAKRLGIDITIFEKKLIKNFNDHDTGFDRNYRSFFLSCFSIGLKMNVEHVDRFIVLANMIQTFWKEPLFDLGITTLEIQGFINWIENKRQIEHYKKHWEIYSRLKPVGAVNKAFTSRITPLLDKYGKDLTASAARGNFIVSIAKDSQLEQLIRNLQSEKGSTTLVVGRPGVGKSFILKHFATKLVVEDVPAALKDKRLISLDLSTILSSSENIGAFTKNLKTIFDEASKAGNTILILEEIGHIFSFRSDGRSEIISLLINILNENTIKIIATSTVKEYQTKIKSETSFASYFDIIEIKEPDKAASFQIIMDEVPSFEKRYKVTIQASAIKRIVDFGSTINLEKAMPYKGIEFLEEIIVLASERGIKTIDNTMVEKVLKQKLGVSVGELSSREAAVLSQLESILHQEIIGQDRAITSIASALRRSRSGLTNNKRPTASFFFYGPTGVGKTHVAKTLARAYFGDKTLMTRINMSEYQEEENVQRLIGKTTKSGSFEGGYLTEPIRTKPFSLLLLDEIEKANPKVLDLFLQVLDDGYIQDGINRKVDFTNTIIIATSNAGSREIAQLVEQGLPYQEVEKHVKETLRTTFKVEFLNRFDDVIMFRALTKIEVGKVAELLLRDLANTLKEEKNINMKWNNQTINELSSISYNPVYGAREVRRSIQNTIENELANEIVAGKLRSGYTAIFNGLELDEILD